MPYIPPEVIAEAKQMDLLTYLQNYEPQELVYFGGNVYTTRTHDSLKISNGRWCWFSRDIGGRSALDYLIKVRGMTFLDAVQHLTGQTQPSNITPPAEHIEPRSFTLPPADISFAEVERYLVGRGIDRELIRACAKEGMLYQTRNKGYANAVFVGYDNSHVARYATIRGTRGDFKGDVAASDKRYSFAMTGSGGELHLFESAVDLLSYATMHGIKTPHNLDRHLLSLSGVYKPRMEIADSTQPPALAQYLSDHKGIERIHLHFDNDLAGRQASAAIMAVLPKQYEVFDEPPPVGKDYNDYLCDCSHIKQPKQKARER